MIEAGCLCGRVRGEIDAPLRRISHCHCSQCRKSHGTAYASYAAAPAASLRWTSGRESIAAFPSSPGTERSFCEHCGSMVLWSDGSDAIYVPAGILDGDPGIAPSYHLFTGSKAPWFEIHDGLPQFADWPPGAGRDPAPARNDARPGSTEPVSGVRGSCLCGGVAFRIEAPARLARHCFCSRCRKARAAAHASNLLLAMDGLRFLRGDDLLVLHRVPEARHFSQVFCRRCGSKLPRLDPSRDLAIVPMGSLDDDPGLRPREQIFVDSKAAWVALDPRLPSFREGPPPD